MGNICCLPSAGQRARLAATVYVVMGVNSWTRNKSAFVIFSYDIPFLLFFVYSFDGAREIVGFTEISKI